MRGEVAVETMVTPTMAQIMRVVTNSERSHGSVVRAGVMEDTGRFTRLYITLSSV